MIGVGVRNRSCRMSSSLAVLRTYEGYNCAVPSLYSFGRKRYSRTSYQIYLIRTAKTGKLITSYICPIDRKVRVGVSSPGTIRTHETDIRLVLSGRRGGYLVYRGGNRYRLLGMTRVIKTESKVCRKRVAPTAVSGLTPAVCQSASGYVLYNQYVREYGRTRNVSVLNFRGHNFGAVITPVRGEDFTASPYLRYNRYIGIYPANTLVRRSRVSGISTTFGTNGGIVMRATPTMETTVTRRFNRGVKAYNAKGVITTLRQLNFCQIFSAGFNTSLAVVRRTGRLVREVANGNILPRVASYSPN